MQFDLARAFAAIRAHLPDGLLVNEAVDRAFVVASVLPRVSGAFGFECDLAGPPGGVDVGVGLTGLSGRSILQDASRHAAALRDLAAFATGWCQSPLADRIPFVFLEFDTASGAGLCAPSVFAAIDWGLSELQPAVHGDGYDLAGLARGLNDINAAVSLMRAAPLDARQRRALDACVQAIPAGGALLHVGVMLGRRTRSCRLSVGLPAHRPRLEVSGLEQLRHVGEAVACAARLADPGGVVQVDFDLDGDDRRVGVTVLSGPGRSWDAVLSEAVNQGLCSPEKRGALLAWPGTSVLAAANDGMPLLLDREIAHLKVVRTADGRFAAKAYFGVRARPMPRL